MSFKEDLDYLSDMVDLGCRNSLIDTVFEVPYLHVSLNDVLAGRSEVLDIAIKLFTLGARPALVTAYTDLGKLKLQALEQTAQKHKTIYDVEQKASLRTVGWVKCQKGSLACYLLFNIARSLYPEFDFDNKSITAPMLIQITILYNKRYSKEYPMDINRVYSAFYGIENKILYLNKCKCRRFYIRTPDSATRKCPWCRLYIKPTILTELAQRNNKILKIKKRQTITAFEALDEKVMQKTIQATKKKPVKVA